MTINLILQYALSLLVLAVVLWGLGALKTKLYQISARLSEKSSRGMECRSAATSSTN